MKKIVPAIVNNQAGRFWTLKAIKSVHFLRTPIKWNVIVLFQFRWEYYESQFNGIEFDTPYVRGQPKFTSINTPLKVSHKNTHLIVQIPLMFNDRTGK